MPKADLVFGTPLMNAAGFLGFGPEAHSSPELVRLGAFVTNPVSYRPRQPARGPRWLPFPGGFLLHTGYPNPGLRRTIDRHASQWQRSRLPVLVHLLAEHPDEIAEMVRRLESVEGVMGIEIGIPSEADERTFLAMLQAARGELPVVARLPLERATRLASALMDEKAQAIKGSNPGRIGAAQVSETGLTELAGLAAISLGPPRGALTTPQGQLVHGRLYGPAVFPQALAAAAALASAGLAVIGAGGVKGPQEAQAMLAAGAIAVQLDTALWRVGMEEWQMG